MVVKFDLSKDPILEANPTTYEDFRTLMAQFRINMEQSLPSSTNEYKYWRATIKELRVRAIMQNIDAYTLEVDTHYTIRVARAEPKIKELEEKMGVAYDTIQKALGTPNYEAVKAEQEKIMNSLQGEITEIQRGLQDGISESDKIFFHNMVKEAYVVKELVDIRHQRDTATTDQERDVLRARAEQLRLEGIAILDTVKQNTEFERLDLERRVLYMFYGKNIADPRYGEPDTRSEEDKKLWEGYKGLMNSAYQKFKTYSEEGKDDLVPQEELWEQIRVEEAKYKGDIWKDRKYETFSGADMVVYFAFPGYKPIDIGLASLVSYSLYREKKQIRTIGAINTRGITKGPRTISGRLVMTVVREHFVEAIKREIPYMRTIKNMLMDELPPFDILVSFGNEYGAAATLVIHGVTFVDEQKTLTVEDLYTENIFTYLARDIDVMKTVFAKYTDEYDPMMWMSNSFIPDGSEVLGDFYPKELELTQAAGLLENPEPFYGEISGWNATLYDLMYTGVDSGSLTIDSNGNLVDGDSGSDSSDGGDKDKETEDKPAKEPPVEQVEDSEKGAKIHSSNHVLWLDDDSIKKAFDRGILFGGFSGNAYDKYTNAKDKTRRWKLMTDKVTGKVYDSHADMRTRMLEFGTKLIDTAGEKNMFKGSKDNLKFTLRMYDDEVKYERLTGYKIMVTFEYIPDKTYSGTFHKNTISMEPIKQRERHIAILRYWKESGIPWSDLSKAMTANVTGSLTGEKYKRWVNTVSATKSKHGYTSKNEKVGQLDPTQKSAFLSGKIINDDGTPMILTTDDKGAVDIDLHKMMFFPSTINHLGARVLLNFWDLPEDARVIFKFTFVPNTPANPQNKDGDLRYFYMVVKKDKDKSSYDAKKDHAFFKSFNPQNDEHMARWSLYNTDDFTKS